MDRNNIEQPCPVLIQKQKKCNLVQKLMFVPPHQTCLRVPMQSFVKKTKQNTNPPFFHSHAPAKAGKQPWPPCLQPQTKAHLMALKILDQKWTCDQQDLAARCFEQHNPAWLRLKPPHYRKHSSSEIAYHANGVTEPYLIMLSIYWVYAINQFSHHFQLLNRLGSVATCRFWWYNYRNAPIFRKTFSVV